MHTPVKSNSPLPTGSSESSCPKGVQDSSSSFEIPGSPEAHSTSHKNVHSTVETTSSNSTEHDFAAILMKKLRKHRKAAKKVRMNWDNERKKKLCIKFICQTILLVIYITGDV